MTEMPLMIKNSLFVSQKLFHVISTCFQSQQTSSDVWTFRSTISNIMSSLLKHTVVCKLKLNSTELEQHHFSFSKLNK